MLLCFYVFSFHILCNYYLVSLFSLHSNLFIPLVMVFFSVLKILCIFIIVAFFTLAERKILGAVHRRRGPFVVGIFGLLQPIADAIKLFLKELLYPASANIFIFLSAPWWILTMSVFAWFFIPFHFTLFSLPISEFLFPERLNTIWIVFCDQIALSFLFFNTGLWLKMLDSNVVVLILLSISSLNVYGIILAGWSSHSKYAFLGGLRSAAQMISYEVSLGLTILPVVILSSSLNFVDISFAQNKASFIFALTPSFIIFLVSMLAETNRAPFDLPEAEAELVAGYNVEYSAITFAMFFLGEYSNMLLMSVFCVFLFLGGVGGVSHVFMPFKILVFCFFFVIIRASVPRFRYDQLMQLCWKSFLPFTMSFFIFVIILSFWILSCPF